VIQSIELRDMAPRSGYLRSRFARRLMHVSLANEQKLRRHIHFCTPVFRRDDSWELWGYEKL